MSLLTGGVSALGTGDITTLNAPISAGGAFGTVVGNAGVIATTGGVTAVAGNIAAQAGAVSASSTVTGGTGVTATTGNMTATTGSVLAGADVEVGTAGAGNVVALVGYTSQIAGQRVNGGVTNGADLGDVAGGYFGAVQPLDGDTYTIGVGGVGQLGATATFLALAGTATVCGGWGECRWSCWRRSSRNSIYLPRQ